MYAWKLFALLLAIWNVASRALTFVAPSRSSCRQCCSVRQKSMVAAVISGSTTIEKPSTTEKEKVAEPKRKMDEKLESYMGKRGGWAVRLFNDPFNKREFVAMCLSKIVGLTDGQSYQVMMQAHKNGVAVVGRFDLERAELYKTSLVDHGLLSDMIPVEDD
jgi:ATP-dependent Clp protease adaptor protein ClpS